MAASHKCRPFLAEGLTEETSSFAGLAAMVQRRGFQLFEARRK